MPYMPAGEELKRELNLEDFQKMENRAAYGDSRNLYPENKENQG